MHKPLATALFLVSSLTTSIPLLAGETSADSLQAEAQALVNEFVGRLKPQLKQAMEAGGPTNAIEVCAKVAPAIADALSAESGWAVKRVSLKSRNASRAMPDAWEQEVLTQFDQRQVDGEAPVDISFNAEVSGTYRYMQAQGVESICLVCHGQELSQEVTDTLQKYYPDDWATGYSLGQVRGAISLSKHL